MFWFRLIINRRRGGWSILDSRAIIITTCNLFELQQQLLLNSLAWHVVVVSLKESLKKISYLDWHHWPILIGPFQHLVDPKKTPSITIISVSDRFVGEKGTSPDQKRSKIHANAVCNHKGRIFRKRSKSPRFVSALELALLAKMLFPKLIETYFSALHLTLLWMLDHLWMGQTS